MFRLLVALLFLLPQRPLPGDELVARVGQTYGRMRDFSAEFVQISRGFSNQTIQERGHVYLKSGKRGRFEYEVPKKEVHYSDGNTFTIFIPKPINQAWQVPISKMDSERYMVLQIVGSRESPWKNQFERYITGQDEPFRPGNRVVRMYPRDKDLREVRIEVDPMTYWIYGVAFTYANGEGSEFRFSNINTTTPLPDSLFKFEPPPGAEIVKE